MGQLRQILLIENNETDVGLIKKELDKLQFPIEYTLVQQKDELIEQLENNSPSLIISNYKLSSFTGLEALKIVREHNSHLPFIIASDHIGEEKAVDAMLEGASDYAMKNNLDRLRAAVRREILNYEEQQKTSQELARVRDRYESLIKSVDGIVWEADAETFEFTYISPQVKELLGYSPDDWLDDPNFWEKHIHPQDREKTVNFCHRKTQEGENHSFEYRIIDSEGEIIWLRDYVTVITGNDAPAKLRGLMMDISKEKRAEQQRDKAYHMADIGHWELDLIHEELYWSDTVKSLHEVDPDYEPDLDSAINFYKEGKHREKISAAVENTIKTGESFDVELKIISAKNNERWIRSVGEAEYRNGKCVRIYGSAQDITHRKTIEQRLRDVVEHSTNMFYRHDTNHVLNYVSPQSREFLGYSQEEAKKRWTEFATDHPVNEEGFKHTQRAIDTGEAQPAFPLQLKKANGEIIWVHVNEAPLIENGETVAIIGSLTDITEQKRYEEQLKETNQKLKTAQKIATMGYWELDLDTDSVYWSDQSYEIWGIDPDTEITLDTILERMHPDDRKYFQQENKKTLSNHTPLKLEHRIISPDGTVKWLSVNGKIKKSGDGTPKTLEGTVQDITEEKQLKQLLNQTNRLARVGSWELDLSNNGESELYWSEMTREILEVDDDYNPTLEEAIDFYTPQSKEKVEEAINKAIEDGTSFDHEVLVETTKGNERWVRTIGQAEFINGECVRVYGSYQDIHERKTSELELARRNEFIETILDNLPIGIAVNRIDDGETVLMNQKFSDIYGWPKEVLKDVDTFFEKISPDKKYRQEIKAQIQADIQSGDPGRMQWSGINITTKSGEKRIVNGKNIPLFDQNQMISTVIDVTAEKKAEQEKTKTLQRIGDAFFAVDDEWTVTYWNKQAEEVLGMPHEKIVGKNLWDVYDDAVELEFYTQYKKALEEQVTVQFEEFYPTLNKWFEVNAYPSETGLSVYFRDITERKRNHKRLKQLNRELEERAEELAASNAELEQFAYVASHDLQEPLRMVSSFLSRLEKRYGDQLDDKAHQYINFAVDGARRMRQIILDLLNYSRVGQHELEREEVNLNELLSEIKKLEHAAIKESGATVTWDDLPNIKAAETSIQQVFQNLIGNAIKYREPGTKPKVHIKNEEETDTHWRFSVSDNGIGIKEEFHENIFTIFKRLHTQEEYSGTGIGLAVCKKIVERHDGQIWVESEEGKGSTFYFTIQKPKDNFSENRN